MLQEFTERGPYTEGHTKIAQKRPPSASIRRIKHPKNKTKRDPKHPSKNNRVPLLLLLWDRPAMIIDKDIIHNHQSFLGFSLA